MTCTTCGEPAAWESEGRRLCRTHAVEASMRGRTVTLAPPEPPDLVDELDAVGVDECFRAAAEIRRLRARIAELESGQSASAGAVATGLTLDGGSSSPTEG